MTEATARTMEDDATDLTVDESGTLLGDRYRLLRRVGEGAAGIVYAATDERIGADVAIKVVRGSSRRDEITLARFHREARAAGKLGHPNIVRVTDFGAHANGSPYVVMERLDGETLEARIGSAGKLDAATAIDVHIQLADALAAAHAAGVLHRDVKPANVFLTQLATGKVLVKLLDFGLAELYQEPASPRITERGLLVGSLAYLAPERILGAPADERSDVYAIGVSLHESLTGELPFSAPNSMMLRAKILEGATRSLDEDQPDVDPRLSAVVSACLAREPTARIATAAEVRRRLLVVSDELLRERPAIPVAAPPRQRSIVVVSSVAVVLLLTVAAVWWRVSMSEPVSVPAPMASAPPEPLVVVVPSPRPVDPPVVIAAPPPELAPVVVVAPAEPAVTVLPHDERLPRARPEATHTRPVHTTPPVVAVPEEPPAEPEEPPPSRFDQVQEPDWGTPIGR